MPAEPQPAPTPSRPSNPPHTTVEEIAAAADATVVPAADGQHRMVTGVDLRAQSILDGDLFAALAGSTAHGASFAGDAIERGAVAIFTDSAGLEILQRQFPVLPVPVLVHDRPRTVLGDMSALVYGRPSEKMTVIGITGTSGKTTTAYLLEAALTAAGRRTGLIGTIETKIAGARVPSALTTGSAAATRLVRIDARTWPRHRRDGSFESRTLTRTSGRNRVFGRCLHQPLAGSSRLSRHPRGLLPRQESTVHSGFACAIPVGVRLCR